MNGRFLPIFDSGKLIEFPALLTWGIMNWPDDPASAASAMMLLGYEQSLMNSGKLRGHTEAGRILFRAIAKDRLKAQMCGNVAIQIQMNLAARGEPEINKAVFLVSEWASVTKTDTGKSLPSDAKNLRKHFRYYRSVCHYWAAWELMGQEHQGAFFQGEGEIFAHFLMVAFGYQEVFRACAETNWQPWMVPNEFLDALPAGSHAITFPIESDWAALRRRQYRSEFVRG